MTSDGLRLSIRRTWPERPDVKDDYVILLDGEIVGRMHIINGGPQNGKWSWGVGRQVQHAWMRGCNTFEGAKADARKAIARALEQGIGLPIPPGGLDGSWR